MRNLQIDAIVRVIFHQKGVGWEKKLQTLAHQG